MPSHIPYQPIHKCEQIIYVLYIYIYILHVLLLGSIDKESTITLINELAEIGDWDSLCTHLKVKIAVMEDLRHSNLNNKTKKRMCLTSYVNSENPRWDDVVKVICGYPFNNIRLGKSIATNHGVPTDLCTQGKDKLEL